MKAVKIVLAAWLAFLITDAVQAQPKASTTNLPPQTLPQFVDQTLDAGGAVLEQTGMTGAQDFFTNLQQRLASTNIYELGSLKDFALQILPVLDEYEETAPYAAWLRAHVDDLDFSIELEREAKSFPAKARTVAVQRSIWVRQLEHHPLPPLAKAYLSKIKKVFMEEKMPPELAWVAGVESSFDPRARSPAGAAGMFQLMPATARMEHLSLWPFDQRYQPEKSAHAAAHYLRGLHRHYDDWPLALAAYNVGEGRVDKLLKEHQVHSFDTVAKWLPAETQMYVPKVEATILQREGRVLEDLH